MRLAIVHNLPSGGALRAAASQLAVLAGRHEVDLYTLTASGSPLVDLSWLGSRRHTYDFAPSAPLESPLGMFDPLVKLSDLARLERVYRRMARDIDASAPDAVLVHPCRFTQAPRVLAHLSTPSVYFCQEPPRALHEPVAGAPEPPRSRAQRWRELRHWPLSSLLRASLRWLDRAACRAASAVAVNSLFMQEAVQRIYDRRPEVVYLGVDGERFLPGDGERGDHVLSVGALSPLKGFDLVVDAVGRVPAAARPRLVIVSDRAEGGLAEALERQASRCGVALELKARISDAELAVLYQRARLTVYAPVREPFGLVPLESMACGTPVVGVAEGGVRESLEDGVTGVLCPRDADALAGAMLALLADRPRADAMGRAGRARVLERWTWSASVERLEALLARAAKERAAR